VGRGEGETQTHCFVMVAGTSSAAGRGKYQRREEKIVWMAVVPFP